MLKIRKFKMAQKGTKSKQKGTETEQKSKKVKQIGIKFRQRGIKGQLVTFTMCFIVCIIILLSLSSVYLSYNSTKQTLIKNLSETSELVSEKISQQINEYAVIAQAAYLYVDSVDITQVSVTKYLRDACKQYGLLSIDIVSKDGSSVIQFKKYNDDSVFQQAASGTATLSDPIINGQDASFEYIYPVSDEFVVIQFPYAVIGDMISAVKIGDTGSTYILNHLGTKVAHSDFSLVLNQQNNIKDAQSNPSLYKDVSELETKMINGETGFGFYTWKGDKEFGSYAPIAGTNGWSVNVTALTSEFMSGVTLTIFISLILGIASILFATLAVLKIAGNITRPIEQIAKSVEQLSSGDLGIKLDITRHDEVGLIADKVNNMAQKFRELIYDISQFLNALSKGDLTADSQCDYPGEFNAIHTAMKTITDGLNETMSIISIAADQVNSSSEQISGAAQGLASGTAEQAASIEQLSASVTSISEQAGKALDSVDATTKFVHQISEKMEVSNERMQNLNAAMSEISSSSEKISSITKAIEDIAFQTNILALNAAIEAARAGEAGKGFAVVADEVRNLAAKSAEAAKQTSDLIENSVSTIENGKALSTQTAVALQEVTDQSELIVKAIQNIQLATKEQTQAIEQITQGLSQVSSVVQSNAATAEETSASSEEMAAQADTLRQEIEKFHLCKHETI